MTKFFNKFKKLSFGPFLVIFPILCGSVTQNFVWISSTMTKLKKTNDTISRKRPDRRKDE